MQRADLEILFSALWKSRGTALRRVLMQQIFGHPEVYIMNLPGFRIKGVASVRARAKARPHLQVTGAREESSGSLNIRCSIVAANSQRCVCR